MTTQEIINERRQEFVDALLARSDIQTIGELRNLEGEMCAVGLACDLSSTGEWVDMPAGEEWGLDPVQQFYYVEGENGDGNWMVPESAINHYDWDRDIIDWLIDLNDDERFSFNTIADLVRNRFGLE